MTGVALVCFVCAIFRDHRLMLRRSTQTHSKTQGRTSDSGFHAVHFFHGAHNQNPLFKKYTKASYSQESEQDLLVKHLFSGKRKGYFVDLAANDAIDMR